MKIRPLILGVTLTTAMLAAGCDMQNNDDANPDILDNTVANPDVIDNTTVDNDPNVNTTVGTEIDDGVITASVKTAMLADDMVEGLEFDVDTTRGVVRLSGAVDSQAQIDAAVRIAKGVEGVKDVQNELTVKN